MNRLFKIMQFLFLFLFISNSVLAQSEVKEMNKIKRDANYIYSIYTDSALFNARRGAREQLEIDIELFVENSKNLRSAQKVVVKDIVSRAMEIQMRRGTMYRVFLYVNKRDIFPADVIVVDTPSKVETSSNKTNNIELKEEKPIAAQSNDLASGSVFDSPKQRLVIEELQTAQTLPEAWEILDRFCAEKKVRKFGLPKNCVGTDKCFWVVQSLDNSSLIILGKGENERYNYSTKKQDRLSNYRGLSAIWFNM